MAKISSGVNGHSNHHLANHYGGIQSPINFYNNGTNGNQIQTNNGAENMIHSSSRDSS
jgi:hypothetical protein